MKLILISLLSVLILVSCSNQFNKVLKSNDFEFKLKKANEYFAKKKYSKAQILFEDIMPNYRSQASFEDIYYKFAYCAYYQQDYLNAENLFKNFLELFSKAVPALIEMRGTIRAPPEFRGSS